MNEKIELKQCPRCKAGVSIIRAHGAKWVSCRCGIQSSRYGEHIDEKRVVGDWNRRPIEDAQAARIEELERLVDDLRGDLVQSDRVADKVRIAELEEALREIVRLSTPNSVCANCKHCEEIAGGDYCRLTGKELEDASSQECEKFEVGGFIVPGTYEIARKALEGGK